MSTEFLLAKAAEKDRRILELEMRLHEVVQREQSLLKQLDTLYNEKNREREEKQILQCRVDSLEAELSEYTDGSGLKYVTQDEVTAISSPYSVEASTTDRLMTPLYEGLKTSVVAEEEPRNNYKHSNLWPRRLSMEDEEEMNIWVSPKKRSNWISTCDED
jgi:dTDP-D-glucose 4,6-dehydratase